MTLDEAIKHAEEVAKSQENNAKKYPRPNKNVKGSGKLHSACIECAKEHRQLTKWLKELKLYKEQQSCEKQTIKKWLATFNTDSATACFTAIQELKRKFKI